MKQNPFKALRAKLQQQIQADPEGVGASRVGAGLAVTLSALLVLLVLLLALLIPHGSDLPVAAWQNEALAAGLFPPANGEVSDVRTQADCLTVYLVHVPADTVEPYLRSLADSLGAAFSAQAPYVAYADGRDVIVDYDPEAEQLSITVVRVE